MTLRPSRCELFPAVRRPILILFGLPDATSPSIILAVASSTRAVGPGKTSWSNASITGLCFCTRTSRRVRLGPGQAEDRAVPQPYGHEIVDARAGPTTIPITRPSRRRWRSRSARPKPLSAPTRRCAGHVPCGSVSPVRPRNRGSCAIRLGSNRARRPAPSCVLTDLGLPRRLRSSSPRT